MKVAARGQVINAYIHNRSQPCRVLDYRFESADTVLYYVEPLQGRAEHRTPRYVRFRVSTVTLELSP